MRRPEGTTLVEALMAAALGFGILAGSFQMISIFRKPADGRDQIREKTVHLSLVLEKISRAVRDADGIVEAAGSTLLLQSADGTTDFYCFRSPPGDQQGELVLVRDAGNPSGAPAEETLLEPGLTRCQFARAGSLPVDLPPGSGPARQGVACVLEGKVGDRPVRVGTVVHCRNGLWDRDLR